MNSASFKANLTHPHITRGQVLFTCLLSVVTCLLFFLLPNPFPIGYPITSLSSAVVHFISFLIFDKVIKGDPWACAIISSINILLLGVAIHFTGGIMSPFIFFFFCIIISDAANGIEYPTGLITALVVYLGVVIFEATGVLEPVQLTPADVYRYPVVTLILVLATVSFMFIMGQTYKVIMSGLRFKLESELQQKQSIIKELSKLEAPSQIGLLVNKIVHDVRGPLGAISGFIKIFQHESNLSEETRKDCALILSELQRISNLINRMILYSKPGNAERTKICPRDLMETVLSVFSFFPGAKQVEFKKQFAGGDLTFIANKEELQQVFFNILKNSVEALEKTAENRVISIDIADEKDFISINIRDNGPGMPKGVSEKLGREVASSKKEGAGLGLMIVREIIAAHGGAVEFQSVEGVGTLVATRFPKNFDATKSTSKIIKEIKIHEPS